MDPDKQAETLRSVSAQLAETEQRAKTAETDRDAQKMRADTAEGKLLESEKQVSELKTQIASQQASIETEAIKREKTRADKAEETIAAFDKTFDQRVRDRVKLERGAEVVMGPEFRMDGLTDREIQATVIKRLDAEADVSASVPDGVILGRFLAATQRHAAGARAQ